MGTGGGGNCTRSPVSAIICPQCGYDQESPTCVRPPLVLEHDFDRAFVSVRCIPARPKTKKQRLTSRSHSSEKSGLAVVCEERQSTDLRGPSPMQVSRSQT